MKMYEKVEETKTRAHKYGFDMGRAMNDFDKYCENRECTKCKYYGSAYSHFVAWLTDTE